MKLSYIILLIALFSQMVCATASQLAVSPYIHRGLSFSFSLKYNPSYVEVIDRGNGSAVYPLRYEGLCRIFPEMLFSYGIKELVEISLLSLPLLMGYRGRLNVNILNKNENPLLFKNYALSVFGGGDGSSPLSVDISISQFYGGISIGTKAVFSTKRSLELFASPMVVYTHYYLFSDGHDVPNPVISLYELDVPIAARITFGHIIKLSIKAGGTISFLLSQDAKETNYDNDGYITTLNHIPISFFTEFAWHFGGRKMNKERRKQLVIDRRVNLKKILNEEVKSVQ